MTDPHAAIFLIGYRGTGKSTVAALLAERLGWESVDTDHEIERLAGKSIAAIFADEGEPAFRDLETQVVTDFARLRNTVIALGGGAVLRAENRAAIRGTGVVVWLTASADTIESRLAADESTAQRRPSLTAAGGRAEIEQLLEAREPTYRECATLIVATDGKTSADVANEIFLQL